MDKEIPQLPNLHSVFGMANFFMDDTDCKIKDKYLTPFISPIRPPPDLPVLLLLLRLSLLFEAFLRRLLAFLYPFAFLFHNTLLSSVILCLGPSLL